MDGTGIAKVTHVTATEHAMATIPVGHTKNVDAMNGLVTVMVTATGAEMMCVLQKIAQLKVVDVIQRAMQMAVYVMAIITYACATRAVILIQTVDVIMNAILKNAGHVIATWLETRRV